MICGSMIQRIQTKISQDKHFKELLKGASSAFILKLAGMTIGYISLLYITNRYGATNYGILALCMTILSIFTLLPKFGMENAVVRIVGELHTQGKYFEIYHVLKTVVCFTFVLSLLSASLLYFSSGVIANSLLHKPSLHSYLQIIAIAIVSTIFITVAAAYFQGIRNTKSFVFIQTILNQIFFLLFLVTNGFLGLTENIVLVYVFANIISSIISILLLFNNLKNRNSIQENMPISYEFFKIIHLAFPMLLAGSFALLMRWTDILMLGMYKTEADVGIYSAAQRVAGLTSLSLIAINAIAAPKFVQFYSQKDMTGLERIAKQSTKLIFFTSFPLLVIFFIFPHQIMHIFGSEFIQGASTLMILSIGQFINAVSGSVGYIMQMTDHQKIFQNVILIATIINIVLNYFLIPAYGIEGAAFASIISMVFWNVTLVIFIKIKLGFYTFSTF